MRFDTSYLGWLIQLAIVLDVLACIALVSKRRIVGMGLFALGGTAAIAAVVVRTIDVQHAPMSNLFEVFLLLGALAWPLSVFCKRALGVGAQAADALMTAMILFPAGFVFSAEPRLLPPALQTALFAPHVGMYMVGYFLLAKAMIQTHCGSNPMQMQSVDRMMRCGYPFITGGLILGAIWGKLAWGSWWNWDPKEMWSLATWLVFGAYFITVAQWPARTRLARVLVNLGFVLMLITLLWANLSQRFVGLHSYA